MISKISHCCIFVLDQDKAYDFYVNTLGFEVVTDAPMGPGSRWLTVCPKGQKGFEIILMSTKPGMMFDEESSKQITELVENGKMGGAVFECNDIYATYEELSAKGVVFTKKPTKEFYGVEAVFKDDSGNWFSLGQKAD